MKRRFATRIVGAAVLAAGTFAPMTVSAATPQAAAATPLEAMQRDLGLTRDQALEQLDEQAQAARTEQLLRGSLGDTYGGAFFDSQQGKLVVGVTDPAKFGDVRAAGALPRTVRFSSARLDGVIRGLNEYRTRAHEDSGVTGWYSSARDNQVTVTAKPGARAEAMRFVHDAGVDTAPVRVVESRETPRTLADVIGGNAYTINNSARCSVGFSVDGGFVSAGHCGKPGDRTATPSGSFQESTFPGNDYSWVKVDSGETPKPLVNNYQGGTVAVAGSNEATEGAAVCRSGSTSGWHCGTIQAKNQTVQYPEGTVNGLTRTNACAEPGDSGGSWLAGDQAQGVTSGGSGDCSSGGTTYFQPVNPILQAYNLKLLTQ